MIQYGKAFIFIYFGAVKVVYAVTDIAEVPPVVSGTAEALWIFPDPITFTIMVGLWEVFIGLCFVTTSPRWLRIGLINLIVFHQPATFVPFIIAPALSYTLPPILPTFSGLYILKNFAIMGGGLILWHELSHGRYSNIGDVRNPGTMNALPKDYRGSRSIARKSGRRRRRGR